MRYSGGRRRQSRLEQGQKGYEALVFGLLGAGAGAALYFIILATTGYEIGLVAILVGFIVGKAVHAGSRARGGAGYQTRVGRDRVGAPG